MSLSEYREFQNIKTSTPVGQNASGVEIIRREDFSDVTYLLEIRHPMMAKAARPGQFVIVMSHQDGERIPLTIADFDRGQGTITLVIQAVGKTTREMHRDCRVGTKLISVTGPMGEPSHIRLAAAIDGSSAAPHEVVLSDPSELNTLEADVDRGWLARRVARGEDATSALQAIAPQLRKRR